MQFHEIGIVPGNAADIAGYVDVFRKLDIADAVGHLVRDDFPTPVAVERDRIGIEQGKRLPVFAHFRQSPLHQSRHESHAGIFRVSRDTGDESDGADDGMDVHVERIDRELGNKCVAVETAPDVGSFEYRKFGLLDAVFFPTVFLKGFFGDLKGVTEQCIVLIQIVRCQFTDMKIAFDHKFTCFSAPGAPVVGTARFGCGMTYPDRCSVCRLAGFQTACRYVASRKRETDVSHFPG